MKPNYISTLTSKINSIPTLPTIAMQVIETTSNPKSSAKDLMDIISPDISLTTRILKIANSAFYGLSREISSLQHAVTILGFREIRNLVISTVVFDSFKDIKESKDFDVSELWKHSFVCGLAAKIIAVEFRKMSNEFFIAGLIHDIGKLVIYIALPTEFIKLVRATSPMKLKYLNFQAEKSILGITHDEVGMRLLQKWMFPDSLIKAVGFHHRPQQVKNNSLLPLVVHIADILAHIYELSTDEIDDNPFKAEIIYSDIVKLAQSYGIEWSESDLQRFQKTLVENMKKESDTLSLFIN